MASEISEENAFLKDQVHRLSISLSHYQKKHSPSRVPVHDGVLKHLGSESPWLGDKSLLSPLLAEYDLTVQDLNQQILTYQSEIESMASRIEQVTVENSRLHSELRKSLEMRIDQATQSASAGGKRGSDGTMKNVVGTLQQQLEMVTEDRDNYRDLLRKTTNELEIMQKSDQDKTRKVLASKAELVGFQQTAIMAKQAAEELEFSCVKLDEERLRCLKAVQAQEVELTRLQENFSQAKAELKTTTDKNTELKKSLDEVAFQLRKRESEKARTMETEHSLDDKLHIMHITNTDLEGKLLASQRELAVLSGDKIDLEETLSAMQTRVSTLEQREYEAVCHVKESMQIAESALLEKEQISIREQQLRKEVVRLKTTVAAILKEAGERTRNEVDILRVECNKSIDKMGVEIHRLEQECAERQVQLERSQREKKVVEKELEKTLAQKPLDVAQTGDNIHELQKRVCVAERGRDDAVVKLEGFTVKNKMLEAKVLDEKQANEQLTDEHRKWQKQVQEDSQNLREQRMKALSQIDNLKQKLRVSEQAKEAAEMKLVQELDTLEHKLEVREKDMAYRLESCEGSHRKSIHELRNLLTSQHRVGAKWREESKSMAQKFDQTISELKAELIRYKGRSDELTKQLNHMKHVKDDICKQFKDATSSNSSLQQKLKEAEAQGEMAMEQMAELASREKLLLQERRELHKQLDKVKLLMSRNERSSSSHLHSTLYKLPPAPAPGPTPRRHTSAFLPGPTPSLGHHPPPPPTNNAQWNHTLSQLKQSIQQVREDLGDQYSGAGEVHLNNDDNDTTMSEHSVLSRRDLSHSTHFVS